MNPNVASFQLDLVIIPYLGNIERLFHLQYGGLGH